MINMLKMIVKSSFLYIIVILFFLSSCDKSPREEAYEAMNSGDLTVYCDESLYNMMDSVFHFYQQTYPKVNLTKKKTTAREAMKMLISGKGRVIVIARDYLPDEDSIMNEYGVNPHKNFRIADDALVFYTQKDFPLDTLNADQLKEIFTNPDKNLKDYYAELKSEPVFVTSNKESSEFAHIKKQVAEISIFEPLGKNLDLLQSSDSVIHFVQNNKNSIGIGLMSQVAQNDSLKMLRIGFVNSEGKSFLPQPVHLGYIVQGKYPYPVPIYSFVLTQEQNLPYWFAQFLRIDHKAMQYYAYTIGIAPDNANFQFEVEE